MSKKNTITRAYLLGIRDYPDEGNELVFALTSREARKMINGTDLQYESWIDVEAKRSPQWDYMKDMDRRERMKEFWREGWWFHEGGYPDPDEDSDDDFYKWYDAVRKV